jgi:two-component sensor histidine kinase
MAPTDRIEEYVERESGFEPNHSVEIPVFFKRQHIEDQLKDSLAQKETLIQEIHHRVKNNLQVISSLLRLQMSKHHDSKVQEAFESSINRVNTMAAVHELMYRESDFQNVSMRTYFSQLTNALAQFYTLDKPVQLDIQIDIPDKTIHLNQSVPIGLILNEVMCNAFRHGLKDGGTFSLRLFQDDEKCILEMGDNGPGYNESEVTMGLGISLIDILCDQLDANKTFTNTKEGVTYRIELDVFKDQSNK